MSRSAPKKVPRTMIPCRIGVTGVEWMDQIAMEETGRLPGDARVTRSDIIRAALVFAARNDREFRRFLRGQ